MVAAFSTLSLRTEMKLGILSLHSFVVSVSFDSLFFSKARLVLIVNWKAV
ncbi:hypothetical protein M6B38_360200 [Iris pallida]|uniref:Uncharacterized protein n=1 Tax=Iris pallida TaxID=29817 RepID=A0AAX6GKW9_IRIPA|nr:hypothetical protein M6B38_360200 [Iris pallida]